MKRIVIIGLLFLSVLTFAQEWYSGKEKVENLGPRTNKADTLWYGYGETPAWAFTVKANKATYFNANDFGLEYPVSLDALTAYLYDSLYTYTYKIYDKDGTSLLFQSAPDVSFKGYNDVFLGTSLILNDDFWFSVVPNAQGLPRLVCTDVIDSEHSFYEQLGAWVPFSDTDERYEWMTYVSLSPYTGGDTFPPSMRNFAGAENFFMVDANVSIVVQDQSALTEVYGEYNLGAGWVNFPMAADKATYTYRGVIPGQGHGVTAQVRFYAEDNLGYTSNSEEYTVTWSKDLPLVTTGFEEAVFPPDGWTVQAAAGNGFVQTSVIASGAPHGGNSTAVHLDESFDCDNWLITPQISIPNTGFCTMFFWHYGWYLQYAVSGLHEICVSTDKVSWDVIYSGYPPGGETGVGGVWEKVILPLSAYAGSDVYIGFHYQANYEDQWYIDDVSVMYDDMGPVITEIKGNEALLPVIGAYLDNPINLTIKTSDRSGTKSVSGDYDIGGATGSIVLSQSKEEESTWTGTIPAQAAEAVGTINFTMTDIGDQVNTSGYEIEFVADGDSPTIKAFSYGVPVLMGEDMTITLTLEDESLISSVTCFYSKDNWGSETSFPMTLSKMHEYTYQCVIPAEPTETFAEVRFEFSDAPGNNLSSGTYEVKWLDGEVFINDDFDVNHDPAFWNWSTLGSTWALTTSQSISPTHSLTDSPSGVYPNTKRNAIETVYLPFTDYYSMTAYFWAKIDIEATWDFCYLQGTASKEEFPAEDEWKELAAYDGDKLPWQYFEVNLGAFARQDSVRLRFVLVSDTYVQQDGIYIDDFKIISYFKDYAAPLITYAGPAQIQASDYTIPREFTIPVGMGDYKFDVELTDISDINEVKVVYSVDGGPEMDAIPLVSSGPTGIYEMTIPEQPAGSKVTYKVVAKDNSEYYNTAETEYYTIHFGNFLYYQNGDDFTDYLDIIGTDTGASAQAVAVRATMGPMTAKGHYKADLVAITIDNYIHTADGYPCDPMYVHIWEDAYGVPGKDIVEPIYTIPAATDQFNYEITYVDLRPYADKLSAIEGDVFVGFTSAGATTNVMYEVCATHLSVPGYVVFNRSWLGAGEPNELVWTFDPADNYHMSAVIGNYEFVDAPLPPRGFDVVNVDVTTGQVALSWLESNEGTVYYYNVYRGESAGFVPGAPIGTVNFGQPTAFIDNAPVGGGDVNNHYYYKISAVDGSDNESSYSKEVEIDPFNGIGQEILPLTTKLYQNYPNPFNPETTINFTIAENAKVQLSVYNAKGETVESLVNDNLNRGSYNVKFNGSSLTSGIYYTVLRVNEKVMTNKMIMLK
jgi:hypothetical protein